MASWRIFFSKQNSRNLPALFFHLSWYAQSNIISEIQKIMGLLLDFLDSVLPGPEEASPPICRELAASLFTSAAFSYLSFQHPQRYGVLQ
jgi:hypothetical protein